MPEILGASELVVELGARQGLLRKRAGVRAVDGVDISVAAGETVAIVGASGAGKSTLIRTLNLLERPDSGRILVDGQDITPAIRPRLESLSLTDNRGLEADTLDITLDDTDGALALPPRGARVRLALGWAGQPLEDKGEYIVDELEHSGTPDRLLIRARSADLRSGIATKKERSWHGVTLGDLVRSIAAQNNLQPAVGEDLAAEPLDHLDQTAESDANLLTRLARDFDAIATIKDGRLLFMPAGQAATASGQPLPPVTLTRSSGDSHRFAVADRGAYTGVKAYWHDTRTGKKEDVQVGNDEAPADPEATEPSAGNVKALRHTYASKQSAERAARAEWQRLQRGVAEFSLTLAHGRPELMPELPVKVQGFKPQIDDAAWLIARITHRLGDGGLTTVMELEVLAKELPG